MPLMKCVMIDLDFEYNNGCVEVLTDKIFVYANSYNDLVIAIHQRIQQDCKILSTSLKNENKELHVKLNDNNRKAKVTFSIKRDVFYLDTVSVQSLLPHFDDLGVISCTVQKGTTTNFNKLLDYSFFNEINSIVIPF